MEGLEHTRGLILILVGFMGFVLGMCGGGAISALWHDLSKWQAVGLSAVLISGVAMLAFAMVGGWFGWYKLT